MTVSVIWLSTHTFSSPLFTFQSIGTHKHIFLIHVTGVTGDVLYVWVSSPLDSQLIVCPLFLSLQSLESTRRMLSLVEEVSPMMTHITWPVTTESSCDYTKKDLFLYINTSFMLNNKDGAYVCCVGCVIVFFSVLCLTLPLNFNFNFMLEVNFRWSQYGSRVSLGFTRSVTSWISSL